MPKKIHPWEPVRVYGIGLGPTIGMMEKNEVFSQTKKKKRILKPIDF